MNIKLPTKAQLCEKLKALGLTKTYKPYLEHDNSYKVYICLETRKTAQIVDGHLVGSQIDLYDNNTIRIWTSQKHKAMKLAKENGFRIRELEHEAELFIPINKADTHLHSLGAKVKKKHMPNAKSLEALRQHRQKTALTLGTAYLINDDRKNKEKI